MRVSKPNERATRLEINKKNTFEEVHTTLASMFREASADFIFKMAQDTRIDTGMSVASLLGLAGMAKGAATKARTLIKGKIAAMGDGPKVNSPARLRLLVKAGFASNVGKYRSAAFGERLGRDTEANKISINQTEKGKSEMVLMHTYTVYQHSLWGEADDLARRSQQVMVDSLRVKLKSSKLEKVLISNMLRGLRNVKF